MVTKGVIGMFVGSIFLFGNFVVSQLVASESSLDELINELTIIE